MALDWSRCCHDHLRNPSFNPTIQNLHVDDESGLCYPYVIEEDPSKGRILVASRAIEAGGLVFREKAITVGNLHETEPVCLSCWRPVSLNVSL